MLSMWLQRVCQMGKTSQTKSTGLLAGVNNSKWTKALHKSKMSHPLVKAVFKALCSFRMLHLLIQINLMFFFCWYNSLVPHSACVISAVLLDFGILIFYKLPFNFKKSAFLFPTLQKMSLYYTPSTSSKFVGRFIYKSFARGKESQIRQKQFAFEHTVSGELSYPSKACNWKPANKILLVHSRNTGLQHVLI